MQKHFNLQINLGNQTKISSISSDLSINLIIDIVNYNNEKWTEEYQFNGLWFVDNAKFKRN